MYLNIVVAIIKITKMVLENKTIIQLLNPAE